MRLDVIVSGVGGQGVMTLAVVLVKAAVREGYDAHFLAQSDLAQFGTPVLAHVRIGLPAGASPKIPIGRASIAVALERLEALRLVPYLSPEGTALLSTEAVYPYHARFQEGRYPETADVNARFSARQVRWVPAEDLTRGHGPSVRPSAVMLGALAGLTRVVDRDNLVVCLREEEPRFADAEVEAFFEGYRFVTGEDV